MYSLYSMACSRDTVTSFPLQRWATQHSASARRGKAVTPHRVRSGSGSSNGTGSHNKVCNNSLYCSANTDDCQYVLD